MSTTIPQKRITAQAYITQVNRYRPENLLYFLTLRAKL